MMHKLQRPPEPSNLTSARADYTCWENLPDSEKKQIKDGLLGMQNFRCAYCECEINGMGHIEHFRKRSIFPVLTFVWNNLFYSCSHKYSCGKYKDHNAGKINYTHLIDPAMDNPEDFLVIIPSGEIKKRANLSPQDSERAIETIRVFNLNSAELVHSRRNHVKKFSWLETRNSKEIDNYLTTIPDECFITAIYHYFGKRVA